MTIELPDTCRSCGAGPPVRTGPETHRADIEPGIREMIGGAVDARLAAGGDPTAAARSALRQLPVSRRAATGRSAPS